MATVYQQIEIGAAAKTYARELVALHHLELDAHFETPQAEQIRNSMDLSWRQMRANERRLMDELAEDLNGLLTTYSSSASYTLLDFELERLHLSIADDRWLETLALVREYQARIEPSAASFVRSSCWYHLGEIEVAAAFLEHAVSIAPTNVSYSTGLASIQLLRGNLDEAYRLAQIGLSRQADIINQLQSAAILLASQVMDGDEAKLIDAIDVVRRITHEAAKEVSDQAPIHVLFVHCLLYLALAYERIGDQSSARSFVLQALKLQPNDSDALRLLGRLEFKDFPPDHAREFRLAALRSLNETLPVMSAQAT